MFNLIAASAYFLLIHFGVSGSRRSKSPDVQVQSTHQAVMN